MSASNLRQSVLKRALNVPYLFESPTFNQRFLRSRSRNIAASQQVHHPVSPDREMYLLIIRAQISGGCGDPRKCRLPSESRKPFKRNILECGNDSLATREFVLAITFQAIR